MTAPIDTRSSQTIKINFGSCISVHSFELLVIFYKFTNLRENYLENQNNNILVIMSGKNFNEFNYEDRAKWGNISRKV